MNQLRVALIGCGGITEHYLKVYRDLDWVQVVACIDAHLPAAESAAKSLSEQPDFPTPLATTDYPAALTNQVDVVVINTPNHLHHAQAIAALDAGKHVLLQKPVAPTVAEAEEIALAAARAKGTSGLYMSYFDQPLVHDLREMIAQGWFGEVGHCYARSMHRWGQVWSNQALSGHATWRATTAQTGGGCFIQVAVHYVHLLEWMLGQRITRVTAVKKNLHCPGLEGEDIASAILEFESGVMVTLDTAWCFFGEQLSIHGTGGTADYINHRLLLLESKEHSFHGRVVNYQAAPIETPPRLNGPEQTLEIFPPAMGDVTNPLNQHRAFLEAVRDGTPPLVSIASGVEDLRIVAAVYASAHQSCTVTVKRNSFSSAALKQVDSA